MKKLILTLAICLGTISTVNAETGIDKTKIVADKNFEQSLREEWIEAVCSRENTENLLEVCYNFFAKK